MRGIERRDVRGAHERAKLNGEVLTPRLALAEFAEQRRERADFRDRARVARDLLFEIGQLGVVLARIAARVQRLLERRSLDLDDADLFQADPVVEESPALAGISSASIQGRIALGPRAGARVWRVGDDPDAPWVLATAPRHAHLAGFDLHANGEGALCRLHS